MRNNLKILKTCLYNIKLMNCFPATVINDRFRMKYATSNCSLLLTFRMTYIDVVNKSLNDLKLGRTKEVSLPGSLMCQPLEDNKGFKVYNSITGEFVFQTIIEIMDFAYIHYVLRECGIIKTL